MIQVQPVPFWDSPILTNALVGLAVVLTTYLGIVVSRMKEKQDVIAKKVDTVETHTNGMLTALQTKVDQQKVEASHLAEITAKDVKIAELQKPSEK